MPFGIRYVPYNMIKFSRTIVRWIRKRFIQSVKDEMLIAQGLTVGRNFKKYDQVFIDPPHCCHITIGDDVTLAPGVTILAHDASMNKHLGCTRVGNVSIGSRVFIGTGSILLPGVHIGDDVIIGAGSVVTKDITAGVVAAGNPAQVIDSFDSFITKHRLRLETFPSLTWNPDPVERRSMELAALMRSCAGQTRNGYLIER